MTQILTTTIPHKHTHGHTHSCLASTPTSDLTTHGRYAVEKKNYKGSYIVKKTRAKKHPLAPRRPPSAFLTYSQQMRKKAKDENPTLTNTDISRLLGQMWAKASDEVKLPFRKRELEEREKYKVSGPCCAVLCCDVVYCLGNVTRARSINNEYGSVDV